MFRVTAQQPRDNNPPSQVFSRVIECGFPEGPF